MRNTIVHAWMINNKTDAEAQWVITTILFHFVKSLPMGPVS